MEKPEFINGTILREQDLKPEFIPTKKGMFYFLEINPDSKYGVIATIKVKFSILDDFDFTIKERKGISEAFKDPIPVDTSKWVKPDEETIKRELIFILS